MFSYLLGNVNGLVAQMNAEANLKSEQAEHLEEWLLKLERVGKTKRLSSEVIDSITTYMMKHWKLNVKDIDKDCEFFRMLSPQLRAKVRLHINCSYSKITCLLE